MAEYCGTGRTCPSLPEVHTVSNPVDAFHIAGRIIISKQLLRREDSIFHIFFMSQSFQSSSAHLHLTCLRTAMSTIHFWDDGGSDICLREVLRKPDDENVVRNAWSDIARHSFLVTRSSATRSFCGKSSMNCGRGQTAGQTWIRRNQE